MSNFIYPDSPCCQQRLLVLAPLILWEKLVNAEASVRSRIQIEHDCIVMTSVPGCRHLPLPRAIREDSLHCESLADVGFGSIAEVGTAMTRNVISMVAGPRVET